MSSIKKYTKVLNTKDQNNSVCGLLYSDLKTGLNVSDRNIKASSVEHNKVKTDKNESLSQSVKTVNKKNNTCSTAEQSNNSCEINKPVVEKNGHKKRMVQTKTNNFFQTNEKPKNGIEASKVHSPPVQAEERSTEDNFGSVNSSKSTNIIKTKRTTKKESMDIFSPKKSPSFATKKKKLKLSRKLEQSTEELLVDQKKAEQLSSPPQDANLKKKNSMDVFQVMMDNRKKSIGMNSPGKEIVREDDSKEVSALREIKAKRSLSLSKWADLKGAGKKREVEELHAEHVKTVLDKRAKSFKSMLLKASNDTPLKEKKSKIIKGAKNGTPKVKIVEIECSSDSEVCLAEIQTNQNSKKRNRDSKCDSDDAAVKKTKLQSPKKNFLGSPKKVKKPPFLEESVLDSTPKKVKKTQFFKQNSLDSPFSCVKKSQSPKQSFLDSSSNIKKPPSVDSTLVANLSPPLKKKGSMLSYFGKQADKEDHELIEVLYFEDKSENDCESESSEIIKVKFKVKSKKCKLKRKSKIRKPKKNEISDELHEITNNKLLINEDTAILSKVNILTTEVQDDLPDAVKEEIDSTKIVISETNVGLRPKRNIRKPIKYIQESSEDSDSDSEDYEIFSKKTKQDKKNYKKKNNNSTNKENLLQIKQNKNLENIVSPIKIVNLQSPGNMQCMRSPRNISLLKGDSAQTEVLAPLFRKSIPKPIIDQSVIEARRLFLHSGVPDSIRIQVDKVSTVSIDVNYFPSISHIQQIPEESEPEYFIWKLPTSKYNTDCSLVITTEDQQQTEEQHLLKDFISKTDKKNSKNWSEMFNDLTKLNYKEGLKKLKEDFPDFPVYRTFRKLWTKYNIVPKLSGNDFENGKSNENETESSMDCSNKNGSLWTEKYKPAASCDILGNFRSVNSLKKWLESWKEYNELSASKVSKRSRKNSDSSSDFCTSDSESKDSTRVPSNMMVVSGPPGSGKTSCVYAVANELGINVLEVNASSRRTGKKILTELQEATQSHKVLTKMNSDSSANGIFNSLGKSNEENSQKSQSNKEFKTEKLSKKVALFKKNSERNSQNSFKLSNTEPQSQRSSETNIMSLMLIDDADIVFEEDDGFVGALAQLVQSSKRPVLIVASDLNCGHLQRFITDGNVVHFNPLYGKILGPWLDILVLIECNKIIPNLCSTLLDFNKGDIRSTLLQLQYWVLGSKDKRNITEASSQKAPSESHLIDENSMSHSPLDWLDDDSNLSWHKSSAKLNQEIENSQCNLVLKSNKTEFNLSTVLLSELSQTCNLGRIWLNKSNLFNCFQESGDSQIFESSEVVPVDAEVRKSKLKLEQVDLDSLFNLFENMSAVDIMQSCNKCNMGVKLPWQTDLKDSLSESENFTMFQNHRDTSSVWCQYMIDHSSKCAERLLNLENNQTDLAVLETEISRESTQNTLTHLEFSEAIPCGAQLDRVSVTLDYMSSLRTMCRSEKQRSKNNFKRNNRFYHYLNSLSSGGKEKFYDNACSILEF